MMIEVSHEGVVFCHGIPCSLWIESETCCFYCPVDKLFTTVSKHYANKSNQNKTQSNEKVNQENQRMVGR